MCVTNTASRRPAVVSLGANVVAPEASVLSQRLLGPLFPGVAGLVDSTTATDVPKFDTAAFGSHTMKPPAEKPRPKRRRKPQKPGKTAKMNDRHFVVHNYHDHALDPDENDNEEAVERRRGGVAVAFPLKLHAVLDQVEADGLAHIVSWQPHGRCFVVHKPKEFVETVMPTYFRQTKLTSFQRQLNLYGFCRLTRGPDASGYYHELFLRGKQHLCKKMTRTKVKGTKFKAASSPDQEPDFYKMAPVIVSPNHSDAESRDESTSPQFGDSAVVQMSRQPLSFDPIQGIQQMQQAPSYAAVAPQFGFPPVQQEAKRSYADRILDEAVDELFFNDGNEGLDDLRAWDLSSNVAEDSEIEDAQLGMLLEKLLDE